MVITNLQQQIFQKLLVLDGIYSQTRQTGLCFAKKLFKQFLLGLQNLYTSFVQIGGMGTITKVELTKYYLIQSQH